MRILCLHGNGTSGALFSLQTSSFRRLLGEEYEYIFLDGPIECGCAAGLEKISKGPYFKWSAGLAPRDILEAHEYIYTVIEEEGPFDGVMGFSQGTSIATSILLQHEMDCPEEAPPFKFALFFSSFLVLSPDVGFAQQDYEFGLKNNTDAVLNGLRGIHFEDDINGSCRDDAKKSSDEKGSGKIAAEFADIVASSVRAAVGIRVALDSDIPNGLSNELKDLPRIYHPLLLTQRVKVPTVYVVGRNDPFKRQADLAQKLFDKDCHRSIEHSGGHDVPKLDIEVMNVVKAVEWAIQRSQLLPNVGWYSKR